MSYISGNAVGQTISFGPNGITHVSQGTSNVNTSFSTKSGADKTVIINGRSYTGKRIEIRGGRVHVDGRVANGQSKSELRNRPIKVLIQGSVDTVSTNNGDVTVSGDAKLAKSASGDIHVHGNFEGQCNTVSGDIVIEGEYNVGLPPNTVSGNIRVMNKSRPARAQLKQKRLVAGASNTSSARTSPLPKSKK